MVEDKENNSEVKSNNNIENSGEVKETILKEAKKDYEIEDKTEKVEKLEQKGEQKQLEYFSKDELIKKIEELEEQLKEKEQEIEKLKEERDNFKNRAIRIQADFENAQKRWDKSRQDLQVQYTASILKSFLPLYDSFKKALDSEKDNEALVQFFNQFMNILKSYGAEPIEVKCEDPFDYSIHEAITTIENDKLPENSVVDVIQDGWKLNKDILRYCKVVISKKPKPPENQTQEKEEKKEESTEEKETKDKEDKNKEELKENNTNGKEA
ncbi:MAG: nucleotide exchange factor GrpE [Promethearchaeota archaeon]